MMIILYLKTLGYKRFGGLAQEHLARHWGSWVKLLSKPRQSQAFPPVSSQLCPRHAWCPLPEFPIGFNSIHESSLHHAVGDWFQDSSVGTKISFTCVLERDACISHVFWITSRLPVVIPVLPVAYLVWCWCGQVVFASGCLGNAKKKKCLHVFLTDQWCFLLS